MVQAAPPLGCLQHIWLAKNGWYRKYNPLLGLRDRCIKQAQGQEKYKLSVQVTKWCPLNLDLSAGEAVVVNMDFYNCEVEPW